MAIMEHERKFLISDRSVVAGLSGTRIVQGYLLSDRDRSLRVRLTDNSGLLTLKGARKGASRVEMEAYLDQDLAEQLLRMTPALVEKTRFPLLFDGNLWDVDVFEGANLGLVVAEIELERLDDLQNLVVPSWCTSEVTDDERYYNESLARRPFSTWNRS